MGRVSGTFGSAKVFNYALPRGPMPSLITAAFFSSFFQKIRNVCVRERERENEGEGMCDVGNEEVPWSSKFLSCPCIKGIYMKMCLSSPDGKLFAKERDWNRCKKFHYNLVQPYFIWIAR
uniref:Uncharacterized protein n=1 Tax=Trypanosoma vivax (strain Y486) TaxID=1055687 RepID=G0TUN7_TRYVY|nr:hypothetical protein, unlikely [Trypanosoma vivax Y486]